jgi:hypothetical protein
LRRQQGGFGCGDRGVGELTAAVLEHQAGGFVYGNTGDAPADEALASWAREIVPAVREAIGQDAGN